MTPDQVRAARLELGMSTKELAVALELANGDSATVRKWENGTRNISNTARVAIRLMLELHRRGLPIPIAGANSLNDKTGPRIPDISA
jgi:transcriptional regulator with XRE-family HTH domain